MKENQNRRLHPLLARNRYSDEEWALSSAGRCSWVVEFGNRPGVIEHCGQPSSPGSVSRLCARHDAMARDAYGR